MENKFEKYMWPTAFLLSIIISLIFLISNDLLEFSLKGLYNIVMAPLVTMSIILVIGFHAWLIFKIIDSYLFNPFLSVILTIIAIAIIIVLFYFFKDTPISDNSQEEDSSLWWQP
jgi:uncharacterized protein YacL